MSDLPDLPRPGFTRDELSVYADELMERGDAAEKAHGAQMAALLGVGATPGRVRCWWARWALRRHWRSLMLRLGVAQDQWHLLIDRGLSAGDPRRIAENLREAILDAYGCGPAACAATDAMWDLIPETEVSRPPGWRHHRTIRRRSRSVRIPRPVKRVERRTGARRR